MPTGKRKIPFDQDFSDKILQYISTLSLAALQADLPNIYPLLDVEDPAGLLAYWREIAEATHGAEAIAAHLKGLQREYQQNTRATQLLTPPPQKRSRGAAGGAADDAASSAAAAAPTAATPATATATSADKQEAKDFSPSNPLTIDALSELVERGEYQTVVALTKSDEVLLMLGVTDPLAFSDACIEQFTRAPDDFVNHFRILSAQIQRQQTLLNGLLFSPRLQRSRTTGSSVVSDSSAGTISASSSTSSASSSSASSSSTESSSGDDSSDTEDTGTVIELNAAAIQPTETDALALPRADCFQALLRRLKVAETYYNRSAYSRAMPIYFSLFNAAKRLKVDETDTAQHEFISASAASAISGCILQVIHNQPDKQLSIKNNVTQRMLTSMGLGDDDFQVYATDSRLIVSACRQGELLSLALVYAMHAQIKLDNAIGDFAARESRPIQGQDTWYAVAAFNVSNLISYVCSQLYFNRQSGSVVKNIDVAKSLEQLADLNVMLLGFLAREKPHLSHKAEAKPIRDELIQREADTRNELMNNLSELVMAQLQLVNHYAACSRDAMKAQALSYFVQACQTLLSMQCMEAAAPAQYHFNILWSGLYAQFETAMKGLGELADHRVRLNDAVPDDAADERFHTTARVELNKVHFKFWQAGLFPQPVAVAASASIEKSAAAPAPATASTTAAAMFVPSSVVPGALELSGLDPTAMRPSGTTTVDAAEAASGLPKPG
jgi:hypothetical protein